MKRILLPLLMIPILSGACEKPEELTEEMATEIVTQRVFPKEPVYAEVPQRVFWNATAPQDEYDGLALATLASLERAGLVQVTRSGDESEGEWVAEITPEGFNRLGVVPSARGPALRGWIADKIFDGVRNFVRHPQEHLVGRAEIVFHYANPTDLYDLFETKIEKPLDVTFISVISIYHEKGAWQIRTLVEKERAE